MCINCDADPSKKPTDKSLKLSNYCEECQRIFKNYRPERDCPIVFGYIQEDNFTLIKSSKPCIQVHVLFKLMKFILAVEDPKDIELIVNTVTNNVYRIKDYHSKVKVLSYLTNHIFSLITVDVDFDDVSILTEPSAFDSGYMVSAPMVIKKDDATVASKKDDASIASSINASLLRIEARLKSIENLNLGVRLTALESSLKKPKDVSPYDDDDDDTDDS